MVELLYLVFFWMVGGLFALAGMPLALRLFRGLPDRGLGLLRPFGLVLVTYLSWILGMPSFISASGMSLALALLICTVILIWSFRDVIAPVFRDKELVRHLLVYEIVGGVAYLCWALVRANFPEITGTEKQMDLSLLSGMGRASDYPPQNPWLAGHQMTYYYFGYLSWGTLNKICQAPVSIAFNLCLAALFAQALVGGLSLGKNLTGRFLPACLSAAAVSCLGNLDGALRLWDAKSFIPNRPGLDHWWWFAPARVIDTVNPQDRLITEFPAFSFVLGDLHPHVMAIPSFLLALGAALALLMRSHKEGKPFDFSKGWSEYQIFGLTALCWGVLGVANAWDMPTLGLVLALSIGLGMYGSRLRTDGTLKKAGLWIAGSGILGVVLFLPFWSGFHSQAGGIAWVTGDRTRLTDTLVIFGLFLIPWICFAWLRLRPSPKMEGDGEGLCSACGSLPHEGAQFCHECGTKISNIGIGTGPGPGIGKGGFGLGLDLWDSITVFVKTKTFIFGLGGVGSALLALEYLAWEHGRGEWRMATAFLTLGLAVWLGLSLFRRADEPADVFTCILGFAAFLLIFGCEFFLLRDVFFDSDTLKRMNTVFKLQYQAWILLSVGLPVAFVKMRSIQSGGWTRILAPTFFVLLALSALYLPTASISRSRESLSKGLTLDGLAFRESRDPGDMDAAKKLRSIAGDPVILEAAVWAQYKEPYARMSAFTGLPTVLGWGGHVHQWTGDSAQVSAALADVNEIYLAVDSNRVKELLKKHKVRYVVVGPTEIKEYNPEGIQRLRLLLQPFYENRSQFGSKGTEILKVPS